MLELKLTIKTVYGKTLRYPANPTAFRFAALLGVKTFSDTQLAHITGLGYTITYTDTLTFFA